MKKIAVSSCFMYPDTTRPVFGHKSLSYIENDMAKFCAQKNTMPILIPDFDDELLGKYMDTCAGLILQGGADLSPESYGEGFLDQKRWPGDRHRDEYELKLIKMAVDRNMPILGICRGFQVLNAYFGGTLHQDLETETKTPVEHRNAETYDRVHHQIDISGKILKGIYNADKITVNSVHHQGIKKLGENLVVEAICPDDKIVEAFSHCDKPIFAVQWHPEFNQTLEGTVEPAAPIFNYFLNMMES